MVRRWLIRSLFLLPLLLCVAGWAWNMAHYGGLVYYARDSRWFGVGTSEGVVTLGAGLNNALADGWQGEWAYNGPAFSAIGDDRYALLGFSLVHLYSRSGENAFDFLSIPYWFLTLATAALFFLAWRKTRPKPDSNTAFPIEVAKPHA